jgi:hypothetical protein
MANPAQKQTKPKVKATKLPWWKSFLGIFGIGLAAVAFLATLVAFNGNTDIRSKAADLGAHMMPARCNPWLARPVSCAPGYRCADDTGKGSTNLPAKGTWGKCVAIPTPPAGKRCNMTIKPPVSCDAGYQCVSDKEWSNTSSPLLGQWGHCEPKVTPGSASSAPAKFTAQSCFNRVIVSGSQYYWPDSCRGSTITDMICSQSVVQLTSAEIAEYHAWISRGRPAVVGCTNSMPTVTPTPSYKTAPSVMHPSYGTITPVSSR